MKRFLKVLAYCLLICLMVTEVSPVSAATKVTSATKKEKAPAIKVGKTYTVRVNPKVKETYIKFTLKKESSLKIMVSTPATGSLYTDINSKDYIMWGYTAHCNGYYGKKDATDTIKATGSSKLPKGTYYLCFQSTSSNCSFDDGKKPAPRVAKIKIQLCK